MLDLFVANYVAWTADHPERCTAVGGYRDYCGPLSYPPVADRLLENRGEGPAYADQALERGCALNAAGRPEGSMGIDLGDYDGDGDLDLFATHVHHETNTLYANDGSGNFTDVTARAGLAAPSLGVTGFGAGFLDYDNDGRLDLLVVNGAVTLIPELAEAGDPHPLHQVNQLLRNLGREGPAAAGGAAGGAAPPVRFADVSAGGRDDHGARVTVELPDGRRLLRRVRGDGSYLSAHDPRVLVGLGDADGVEAVTVRWADGTEGRFPLAGEPVDRYLTLVRGTAPEPERDGGDRGAGDGGDGGDGG